MTLVISGRALMLKSARQFVSGSGSLGSAFVQAWVNPGMIALFDGSRMRMMTVFGSTSRPCAGVMRAINASFTAGDAIFGMYARECCAGHCHVISGGEPAAGTGTGDFTGTDLLANALMPLESVTCTSMLYVAKVENV